MSKKYSIKLKELEKINLPRNLKASTWMLFLNEIYRLVNGNYTWFYISTLKGNKFNDIKEIKLLVELGQQHRILDIDYQATCPRCGFSFNSTQKSEIIDERLIRCDDCDYAFKIDKGKVNIAIYPRQEVFEITEKKRRWRERPLSDLEETISEYDILIHGGDPREETLQEFLELNFFLLDASCMKVLPKQRLGEDLVVDFLIQKDDTHYVAVEIEKPQDKIVTQNGEISSKTTHAKGQVQHYMEWLTKNHLYVSPRFGKIDSVTGLVVIGLEDGLNDEQKSSLNMENNSLTGIKIVGFDYLLKVFNRILEKFKVPT